MHQWTRIIVCLFVLVWSTPGLLWAQNIDRRHFGIHNVLSQGSGNCVAASLNTEITSIGTAPATVWLSATDRNLAPCTWTIDVNVTTPRNVTVIVPHGARAIVSTGITMTFNGPVQAEDPDWYSGAGTVVFNYKRWGSEEGYSDLFQAVTISGCLHGTSANTVSPTFPCVARTNTGRFFNQSTTTVTYSGGNGTYWLIGHKDISSTISGWTRQSGTHYLWKLSATQPETPLGSILLAQVTVSAGVITEVVDLRQTHPFSSGIYTVSHPLFGGVADTGVDQSAAIQKAINAACSRNGGIVYLPKGTWTITTMLDLDDATGDNCRGLTLMGDGPEATILSCTGAISCMDYSPPALQEARLTLRDLRIMGTVASALDLVSIGNAAQVTIEHVHLRNTANDCLSLSNVNNWHVRNSRIEDCGQSGIEVTNSANAFSILDTDFNTNTAGVRHILLSGAGWGTIHGSNFEGATLVGNGIVLRGTSGINITGNFFEMYTGAAIRADTVAVSGVTITNNHLSSAASQVIDFSPNALAHRDIWISHNRFAGVSGGTVLFDPGTVTLAYEFCANFPDGTPSAYVVGFHVANQCISVGPNRAESMGLLVRNDQAATWRYNGSVQIGGDGNAALSRTGEELNINSSAGTGTVTMRTAGVNRMTVLAGGGLLFQSGSTFTASGLGGYAPSNGTIVYCSDCAPASAPCTGTSTGAIAKRLNGAWDCR